MSFIDKIFGSSSADDSAKQLMSQIEQRMYGTPIGTQVQDVNGNIYVNTGNGIAQVGIGSITNTTTTAPVVQPYTAEDAKELERLEADRQMEIKRTRLEKFKKVPAAIRQQIVDEIVWHRNVNDISNTDVTKSERQQELERKQMMNNPFAGGNPWNPFGAGGLSSQWLRTDHTHGLLDTLQQYPAFIRRFAMPAGLTEEDILQAHNDACAEEALLTP